MKRKSNDAGDIRTVKAYDTCQTPHYAFDPLMPYLPHDWLLWEPAVGEGQLSAIMAYRGWRVIVSGASTGENFFDYNPVGWDCQVTNPPYSIKYQWLARSYDLGKPFALLLPVEVLGAAKSQRLFKKYGIEVIFMSRRVNFKMPYAGYRGTAQFPVAWFTWGLNIGRMMVFEHLERYEDLSIEVVDVK